MANVNTTNTTTATTSATATAATRAVGGNLGKDDFLKLLTAQLQFQDPMNPMEDKDFMGQMAQFSSLEQITNLAQSMNAIGFSTQVSQGVSLIGRTVDYTTADGEKGSGTAGSVAIVDGAIQIDVGGRKIASTEITGVR
jgi:flagellar basal-body rod modification protein FlgD